MIVITWEKCSGGDYKVSCSGAKNPIYFFLPDDQRIEVMQGSRRATGGEQNVKTHFTIYEKVLPESSIVFMASDGFEDQNNKQRRRIGRKRLVQLLEDHAALPFEEQKMVLEQNLSKHMLKTTQRDDLLLIGFKL